ncbi:ubiquinone biosynthesis accessory factor UbiJ [Marinobacterium mangrovicola]|uniref:Ubiquinone biosynthesis accessory factor UbiJ n=1 Tax=Marinobacterium mangrovicola TaxID=1476959 RepID=A0A4R1G987_9GAMM|nr:SCP2 sterol-binding domain-containing protein [Marinobacterium mangrovicola]TCK04737.1 ubiquinone biosynthesis protein UbiJ [Marinobacterium mangrovicola]
MPFQLLNASVLSLAESSLNRLLANDPATLDRLGALTGKVIAIESTSPVFHLYVLPHGAGLDLLHHYEGNADVTICGSALLLARLPIAGNEVLFGKGVSLRGDSTLAHKLQSTLADTRIDWEAWLGNLMGDAAGHEAAKALRSLFGYSRDSASSLLLSTREYLQEEAKLLPTRVEIEIFMDEVDELRERAERLEARIRQAG